MLYGAKLTVGAEPQVISEEDGGEILHLSAAVLPNPKESGRTCLYIHSGEQSMCIAVLQKDKCEMANIDLFVPVGQGSETKLSVTGAKNEVHVSGYFEPNMGDISEDEHDEDDEEMGDDSSSSGDDTPAPTTGTKGKAKIEEIEEENDEDDSEDDGSGEESDTSEEKPAQKRAAAVPAKESQKKKQKSDKSGSKGESDGNSKFEADLIQYLKKNGKTALPLLGTKVSKPADVTQKLGAFIRERPNVFKVEKDFVSLA